MTVIQKVAKRIRELRKMKKMSQENLAEKANLHPTLIGKIERAEINPTIGSLEKITKALNISLAELLTFSDDKKIVDADVVILNRSIEILIQILEIARGYKKNR